MLEVGRLEMFLGIGPDAYAEKILPSEPFALEAMHCPDKFVGVAVASRFGREALLAGGAVAPEGKYVAYAHEVQVLKLEFYLLGGRPSADQMGHDLDLELRLYDPADRAFADSPPDQPPDIAAVGAQGVFHLVAVAGDVDVFRAEFHERAYLVQELVFREPGQRRHYLK